MDEAILNAKYSVEQACVKCAVLWMDCMMKNDVYSIKEKPKEFDQEF
jgi:hypothetical protein